MGDYMVVSLEDTTIDWVIDFHLLQMVVSPK